MKKDKILLKASVIGALVALLVNLTVVYRLESVGSALVLVASETVVTLFYILYTFHHKLVHLPLKYLGQSIVCAIPSLLVCLLCGNMIENPSLSFLVALFAGGTCWLVSFYFMKGRNIIRYKP